MRFKDGMPVSEKHSFFNHVTNSLSTPGTQGPTVNSQKLCKGSYIEMKESIM